MQIRQILKPCATCGESLIFGHFAPQGDVQPVGNGLSRVCCPSCNAHGPLGESFREACNGWDTLSADSAAPLPAATATDEVPNNPWPIHSSAARQPATSAPR